MKKKFPYNFDGLTWDADHNKNMEDKYCYCGKGIKETQPMIRCDQCKQLFHRDCIHCMVKPLLFGDTFGVFHCAVCNRGPETFERKPMSWISIVHLVIYNLIKNAQIEDVKKPKKDKREHYYFRWKEDVCAFIDDYWDYLMPEKTRSATWNNTIASVLSTHGSIFLSGLEKLHQSAWWTLHTFEPPKNDKKTKLKPTPKRTLKRSKENEVDKRPKRSKREKSPAKKEQSIEDDFLGLSSLSELSSSAELSDTEEDKKKPVQQEPLKSETHIQIENKEIKTQEAKEETEIQPEKKEPEKKEPEKKEPEKKEPEKKDYVNNTNDLSQSTKPSLSQQTTLSPQDEWLLLQKLEHSSKKLSPAACRYKRKLAVRRLKRNLGIKLFDMDTYLIQLLKSSKPILEPISNQTVIQPASNQHVEQTQDDQEAMLNNITYTPYASSFASRLYGSIRQRNTITRDEPWLSSWNGRKLRPFIRRDFQSQPKRMLLMGQIKACAGKPHTKGQSEPSGIVSGESIDYVYFQKEHLSQVNHLLSRTFWEGIDVSESLLFPEFSIVALYKRRVIGCAFMTPEAYITYFAVDPGWTNASIGQFMLYHLFQTAISKDITLHVSANNNAMILYQKFGFKPEEFIVNFYDKYLPADSVYSKNAFLLRLRR